MIARQLSERIISKIFKGKAIIILGPRQTGKTTLLKKLVNEDFSAYKTLWLDADDPSVRAELSNPNLVDLKRIIGKNQIIVVDEAQRISSIGLTLKMITDHFKSVQLLVTGSSALDIAQGTTEPLTGRKYEYLLLPLAFEELQHHQGFLEEKKALHNRLIFGAYPEIVTTEDSQLDVLKLLSGSYLYKDVFKYKDLRRPELLEALLQALAFQLGSEVSFQELSTTIGADPETVRRYIELLEKTYVIFRLRSLSRNLRNELKKSRKIYFFDNGIRNALINNFSPLNLREDRGALWENFLMSERMKYLSNHNIYVNPYFWRTHQQQEIDYIEDLNGKLYAYEFKWNIKSKARIPLSFSKAYPNHSFQVITPENYPDFLLPETT